MVKYITELNRKELIDSIVIDCESEDNYPCILVKNMHNKRQISNLATDNLSFKLNSVLLVDDEEFFFHIIKSKKSDYEARQQFRVVYNYLFNRIDQPVDDTTMYELVESLQEYFSITPASDKKALQIGVFGELFTLLTLYENGYPEIVEKFHKNFYSRHDIEINSRVRVEIKTTEKETRIHEFKHEQICRNDVEVYVVSLLLELSQEGLSLYELFLQAMELISDVEDVFMLEKLMRRCEVSASTVGIRVSRDKATEEMRFYEASRLPMIDAPIPNGVTGVKYNVDCSMADSIEMQEFIAILKAL